MSTPPRQPWLRNAFLAVLCAFAFGGWNDQAVKGFPDSYPKTFGETVKAGEAEGRLVIWSTTDRDQVAELVAAFLRKYPGIAIEYRDMPSAEIHRQFMQNIRQGRPSADILWSSAMDLQIKLVNDGFALRYETPERRNIAKWANWKNQAWAITAEPIVFVYNSQKLSQSGVPVSHRAVIEALAARNTPFRNTATYDPEASAFGYLLAMNDNFIDHRALRLASALGQARGRLHSTTQEIIADVDSGPAPFGYNIIASYALEYAKRHPNIRIVVPHDYILYVSRVCIIPANAPHQNAAKLFLTFLLSREGQYILSKKSMAPTRLDVPVPQDLQAATSSNKKITLGPSLLVMQDVLTKKKFLRDWHSALGQSDASRPR